jgi:hypothetical protein
MRVTSFPANAKPGYKSNVAPRNDAPGNAFRALSKASLKTPIPQGTALRRATGGQRPVGYAFGRRQKTRPGAVVELR